MFCFLYKHEKTEVLHLRFPFFAYELEYDVPGELYGSHPVRIKSARLTVTHLTAQKMYTEKI